MAKPAKDSNIDNIRHSLAHLLAMAVLKKFPKAKLGIGPTIENGFYYDFKLPKPIGPEDLKEFEAEIKRLILEKLDFKGEKVSADKARKTFKDQPFKRDLIKEFSSGKKQLTFYHTGNFTDLCKGGHVKNTSEINPDGFALTKIAGAYWRGDEKNPQLTRIYGVAFANLLFLPIANKLKSIIMQQTHLREMVVDGLAGIANGDNPRLIEIKLQSYLD